MQKVIITGGTGLLGSNVVFELLRRGVYTPVVVGRQEEPKRLKDVMDKIEYFRGDVADAAVIEDIIAKTKPKKIYHFAAFLGDYCEDDPIEATRVNVNGVQNLFELALKYDVEQVIFSSSLGVFGYDLDDDEIFTDKTLQRPFSYYGVTKLFAENTGRFYKRKYGLDFRSVRYPAIVGPGVRAGGIVTYTSAIIERSFNNEPYTIELDEDTTVAIIHVEDAAKAAIDLSEAPLENIKMTNYLVNGLTSTPKASELVEMVEKKIPDAKIDFKPNPNWSAIIKLSGREVDDSYARSEWGWNPTFDSYDKIIDAYLAALKK
jgi:nucleoside-diphosphate-sugar epimerase